MTDKAKKTVLKAASARRPRGGMTVRTDVNAGPLIDIFVPGTPVLPPIQIPDPGVGVVKPIPAYPTGG